MQLQGKKIQNREIRIKRIETKTNINKMTNKTPISFKMTRPTGRNGHQFQGETMKLKMQKQVTFSHILQNYYYYFLFQIYTDMHSVRLPIESSVNNLIVYFHYITYYFNSVD